MDVPVLESERLIFRGHRVDDFPDCAAMWADPLVTRHIGGCPFSAEETWTKVLRYVGHWQLLGFGYWVMREKVSGRFVGEAGFADFRRQIEPSFQGAPEMGWALTASAQGKGLATEAVRAALDWGRTHLRSDRTACMIDPDNLASIRVAQKCGFREYARTTYKGHPTLLFEQELTEHSRRSRE